MLLRCTSQSIKQLHFITKTVTEKNESSDGVNERKVLTGGGGGVAEKPKKIPARENVCKKIHAKKTSVHGVADHSP